MHQSCFGINIRVHPWCIHHISPLVSFLAHPQFSWIFHLIELTLIKRSSSHPMVFTSAPDTWPRLCHCELFHGHKRTRTVKVVSLLHFSQAMVDVSVNIAISCVQVVQKYVVALSLHCTHQKTRTVTLRQTNWPEGPMAKWIFNYNFQDTHRHVTSLKKKCRICSKFSKRLFL